MEQWLHARDYQIVPKPLVTLSNALLLTEAKAVPTSIDQDLPHCLTKICRRTVSLRVLNKAILHQKVVKSSASSKRRLVTRQIEKQFFLLVRDATTTKLNCKDLAEICSQVAPTGDILFVANAVSPVAVTTLTRCLGKYGHTFELLSLKDPIFAKLESQLAPAYSILNRTEIEELEHRFATKRALIPRIVASQDAMARYLGLKPGQVVQNMNAPLSYRVVV